MVRPQLYFRIWDILILWEMAESMNVSLDERVGRKKMSKAVGL